MIVSRLILLKMRSISDKAVEKIETHNVCSVTFSEYGRFYEIMWKNMLDPERPQII